MSELRFSDMALGFEAYGCSSFEEVEETHDSSLKKLMVAHVMARDKDVWIFSVRMKLKPSVSN